MQFGTPEFDKKQAEEMKKWEKENPNPKPIHISTSNFPKI
jgi:hypothetical protein